MVYRTKQKDKLVEIIKDFDHEFTIKEIYDFLDGSVGLTTIYRLVDKLVNEGKINKTINNNNVTYYQYLGVCQHKNHFYLKCDICSKLEHVDCDCITDLWEHIYNNHEFKPSKGQIIINGICKKCNRKGDRKC